MCRIAPIDWRAITAQVTGVPTIAESVHLKADGLFSASPFRMK